MAWPHPASPPRAAPTLRRDHRKTSRLPGLSVSGQGGLVSGHPGCPAAAHHPQSDTGPAGGGGTTQTLAPGQRPGEADCQGRQDTRVTHSSCSSPGSSQGTPIPSPRTRPAHDPPEGKPPAPRDSVARPGRVSHQRVGPGPLTHRELLHIADATPHIPGRALRPQHWPGAPQQALGCL